MKLEQAFGVIPVRKHGESWQVFVVKRTEGFWEFPKGHPDEEETEIESAVRELKEESGLTADNLLRKEPFIIHYQYQKNHRLQSKSVRYYLFTASGNIALQEEEVVEGKWVDLQEATQILTYDTCKSIAAKVALKLSQGDDYV